MIRQSNTQTYIKHFNYINLPQLSIPNIPQNPYYDNYKSKSIILNNNNKLIYGR